MTGSYKMLSQLQIYKVYSWFYFLFKKFATKLITTHRIYLKEFNIYGINIYGTRRVDRHV